MLARFRRLLWRRTPKTLASLDAYARWAASYPPQAHNPLMHAEQDAVLSLLPDLNGCIVLDLACGTGRYGQLALERGARRVLGLDNSMAMLKAGQPRSRLGVSRWLALSTVEALPLAANTIDVALCGLALGHLPSLTPSMAEISRALRPGGWFLVSDFHPFLYLSGARRTFTTPDGRAYAVEHYVHLYADYHRAAREAGLIVDRVLEPTLASGVQGANIASGAPAAIVLRLRKP